MYTKKTLITIIFLIIWMAGCGKEGDSPKIAKLDDKVITQAQFDNFLKFKRIQIKDNKNRQKIIDQYLNNEVLASAIEKDALLDKSLIAVELNEFKKEMLISRYFEKYLKNTIREQAIKNYYNTHAEDYNLKKLNVAHILIRTNKKMSEIEKKAKLTTAQEVYSQVQSGKDFAEAAKDYSEDKTSAKKGGHIGWIKEGNIDPKFSETAFKTKPGEISGPIETPFGFHVIKVLEGPVTVKKSFNAVSGNIRYQLRNKAKKKEIERLVSTVNIEREEK